MIIKLHYRNTFSFADSVVYTQRDFIVQACEMFPKCLWNVCRIPRCVRLSVKPAVVHIFSSLASCQQWVPRTNFQTSLSTMFITLSTHQECPGKQEVVKSQEKHSWSTLQPGSPSAGGPTRAPLAVCCHWPPEMNRSPCSPPQGTQHHTAPKQKNKGGFNTMVSCSAHAHHLQKRAHIISRTCEGG